MSNETSTQPAVTLTFAVEGMTCQSCVRHVAEALDEHLELIGHQVDLSGRKLTVSFNEGDATQEAIAKVMNEAGFSVSLL